MISNKTNAIQCVNAQTALIFSTVHKWFKYPTRYTLKKKTCCMKDSKYCSRYLAQQITRCFGHHAPISDLSLSSPVLSSFLLMCTLAGSRIWLEHLGLWTYPAGQSSVLVFWFQPSSASVRILERITGWGMSPCLWLCFLWCFSDKRSIRNKKVYVHMILWGKLYITYSCDFKYSFTCLNSK